MTENLQEFEGLSIDDVKDSCDPWSVDVNKLGATLALIETRRRSVGKEILIYGMIDRIKAAADELADALVARAVVVANNG